MVVRVRVKVRSLRSGRESEVVVLVNSGAASESPLIAVPPEIARDLGLWPPEEAQLIGVEQAVGVTEAYMIPRAVKLTLLGESGEALSEVVADLVVQEGLWEPLITDATIDALGIRVIRFKEGLWRHEKDPEGVVRPSAHRLLE